jgi:hypothetical protein
MQTTDLSHDACASVFTPDDTGEGFDINAVQDPPGDAQFEISAEDAASDEEHGNGAERREDALRMPDAWRPAANSWLDVCEHRGMAEVETDVLSKAMALLCSEQVQNRRGPLYEAIRRCLHEARDTRGQRYGRPIRVGTRCRTPAHTVC